MRARLLLTLVATLSLAGPAQASITRGWSTAADVITPRANAAAVALDDGRVLVAGGNSSPSTALSSAELYDPATNTWAAARPMLHAHARLAMVKLTDGRVLVTDGFNGNDAEIYNPAKNIWSAAGDFASSTRYSTNAALFALSGGRALQVGPPDFTGELYDSETNTWSPVGATTTTDRAAAPLAALPGERFLLAGGEYNNYEPNEKRWPTNTAAILDLADDGWQPAAPLSVPRALASLTTLKTGGVLAAGGQDASYTWLRSAEVYDPLLDRWSPTGPMLTVQRAHVAVTLADGSVMVVGGNTDGGGPSTATQVYSPQTNRWTSSGSMTAMHYQHTAVTLNDGRVLVTGGQSLTPIADLWTPTTTLSVTRDAAGITLINTGEQPLFTEAPQITGADAGEYKADAGRCRWVAARASCTIPLAFTPTRTGEHSAVLSIDDNTASGTHSLPLTDSVPVPVPAPPPADGDADGVADSADRCPQLAGPAGRGGCPTGLLADPSIAYRSVTGGIKVVAYYVKATTGAKLEVTCSKHACKRFVGVGRGNARVRVRTLNGKRLANGTKVTIAVSAPGHLTTTVKDTIARNRRSEGRPHCTPVAC